MNSLNRELTAQILGNPYTYPALRKHWSALVNSERKHDLTAAHHLIYLALLGKDWRKAFHPVVNARDLLNGGYYNWGLFDALHRLRFAPPDELLVPFDGLISYPIILTLRTLLPTFQDMFYFRSEQFIGTEWPFEAFTPTELVPLTPTTETANA